MLAGLVVTRRSGREKLHYLNAVPIRQIHNRWIDKYTERHVYDGVHAADVGDRADDRRLLPFSEMGGGGWNWILSDLKSLLGTGKPMSGE